MLEHVSLFFLFIILFLVIRHCLFTIYFIFILFQFFLIDIVITLNIVFCFNFVFHFSGKRVQRVRRVRHQPTDEYIHFSNIPTGGNNSLPGGSSTASLHRYHGGKQSFENCRQRLLCNSGEQNDCLVHVLQR